MGSMSKLEWTEKSDDEDEALLASAHTDHRLYRIYTG
jgi:hypothetical protein